MKRSLLKLLTSIYIMLVSVILIVISAYAWFTLSDAPETRAVPMEVAGRDAIGLPAKTYSIWDGTTVDPDDIIRDQNGAYVIYHAAEFATAMRLAEDPAIGDMTIRMEADISLADLNWRPVTVTAGAGSTKTVTILGNNMEVVCTTAPLFAGGLAGQTSIEIENLTVAYSDISSYSELGTGAFIEGVVGMNSVELDHCRLYATDVTGTNVGGLIGWTEGISGSVDTNVTVSNCTVENCQLIAVNTVGGILGHAGADAATYQEIRECHVINSVLKSTNSTQYMGVGTILGTANLGDAYVIDCEATDIIEVVAPNLEQENLAFAVYGVEDYGYTGKLVITNGTETLVRGNEDMTFFVRTPAELEAALQYAASPEFLYSVEINIDADMDMSQYPWTPVVLATAANESGLTINGRDHTISGLKAPLLAGGTKEQKGTESLVIRDLTIADSAIVSTNTIGSAAFIECTSGLTSITMENCHLISSTITGDTVEGTRMGALIGWTAAGKTAKGTALETTYTITGCTVRDSVLESFGSVGGLIGHAGYHKLTNHIITDCEVSGTTLRSIESPGYKGVGTIVGTVNLGRVTIENCVSYDNTEYSVEEAPDIYDNEGLEFGRLALSSYGQAHVVNENGSMSFVKGYADFRVSTEAGLRYAMEYLASADYSGEVTITLNNDIDLTDPWTPILLATEGSTDTMVIDGNDYQLTGLTAPLLAGGVRSQQGMERLEIRNLTIADSAIVSTNTMGNGALIECVAGLTSVTLNNCQLSNVDLSSDTYNGEKDLGSRTGGFIGWTSSAIDETKTALDTYIALNGCVVEDSSLTGFGTVGGMIGHAGYHATTYHEINNCYISNTTLTSTETPYKGVGTMIGTANIGKVYINDCSSDNVTENVIESDIDLYNEEGLLYGRFVSSGKGELVVDGVSIADPSIAPVIPSPSETPATPAEGGTTTPTQGSESPAQNQETPADDAELPADDAELPADDAELPADDAELPADDAELPADDAELPADDAELPADDAELPADDAELPADDAELPADDAELPADDAELPADDAELPADDAELPADDAELPADDAELPADDAELPADDAELPADDTELPADDAELPADDAELPADDAELPADDAELPTDDADSSVGDNENTNNETSTDDPTEYEETPSQESPEVEQGIPATEEPAV